MENRLRKGKGLDEAIEELLQSDEENQVKPDAPIAEILAQLGS